MIKSGVTEGISAVRILRLVVYTFSILLIQAHFVTRLPYQALRADLLLPLMFGIAAEWPPTAGLLWACFWGFLADNFSGMFWGLHVGSYVMAVCLVHMASERFDCQNPFYQMCLVGLCAAGQSVAIG